ncbi:DegT/DnrJ/EryC1/StrS family aminotransferase [Candidatus Woesearchaeota archaeon]|nr:DegT/DnrJ/EryC1/StrS family aminotransferase [Candidatus Woesearchaeota archaeon]
MEVPYSYLLDQFSDPEPIFNDMRALVKTGDYTLGKPLIEFEQQFAAYFGTAYAIGVGTGTDALRLSLLALDVKPGDEVITAANTFYSTAAAIATIGAIPVFADVDDNFVMDIDQIEASITKRTKAIIPVHLHGCPVDMHKILSIARKHNLHVVEDACQAIGAEIDGKKVGSFGSTGCFSLHPLKNINVWGDGGVITTNSEAIHDKLLLLRNNGLKNRDECMVYAYNCRLDTLQAVVGLHVMKTIRWIIDQRVKHGAWYDKELSHIQGITVPPRRQNMRYVHHNYVVQAEGRDGLLAHLRARGVDAKVHYPLPLHLQEASNYLHYHQGDFPAAEQQAKKIISLPVHQHLHEGQLRHVVTAIKEFY